MEQMVAPAGLLGVLLVGTVSPGPSFALVARTAVAHSRRDGLAAAPGMGVGGVVFAALVLLGLTAVLARVPLLYAGLKLLSGLWRPSGRCARAGWFWGAGCCRGCSLADPGCPPCSSS